MIQSGYALVCGLPNTGKSSLMNAITGTNISPVTPHPASTRIPITAIATPGNAQVCFVDTPPLGVGCDWSITKWIDVVVLVLDIRTFSTDLQQPILKQFLTQIEGKPVVLALSRSDYVIPQLRMSYVLKAIYLNMFSGVVPITPAVGRGIPELMTEVLKNIPVRNRLFPRDATTLNSVRFLVSEQVRTQLFDALPLEIASETAVQIEEISRRDGKLYIMANLIVSRASYKGILIGRKGQTLENIGRISSSAIREFTGENCRLDLWVKVREAWTTNKTDLMEFGYVC